jgi:hypothetical protein
MIPPLHSTLSNISAPTNASFPRTMLLLTIAKSTIKTPPSLLTMIRLPAWLLVKKKLKTIHTPHPPIQKHCIKIHPIPHIYLFSILIAGYLSISLGAIFISHINATSHVLNNESPRVQELQRHLQSYQRDGISRNKELIHNLR